MEALRATGMPHRHKKILQVKVRFVKSLAALFDKTDFFLFNLGVPGATLFFQSRMRTRSMRVERPAHIKREKAQHLGS